MKRPRLVVAASWPYSDVWTLAWFVGAGDDDIGARVGERGPREAEARDAAGTAHDPEVAAVYNAAVAAGGEHWPDGGALVWRTRADARRALRACKLALKAIARPLPEWATAATAAGWRPPRGWRP